MVCNIKIDNTTRKFLVVFLKKNTEEIITQGKISAFKRLKFIEGKKSRVKKNNLNPLKCGILLTLNSIKSAVLFLSSIN